jgi:hypothetical protein
MWSRRATWLGVRALTGGPNPATINRSRTGTTVGGEVAEWLKAAAC